MTRTYFPECQTLEVDAACRENIESQTHTYCMVAAHRISDLSNHSCFAFQYIYRMNKIIDEAVGQIADKCHEYMLVQGQDPELIQQVRKQFMKNIRPIVSETILEIVNTEVKE